jgi:hypothetical protein
MRLCSIITPLPLLPWVNAQQELYPHLWPDPMVPHLLHLATVAIKEVPHHLQAPQLSSRSVLKWIQGVPISIDWDSSCLTPLPQGTT